MTPAAFLFPSGAMIGKDNVVLHARARRHKVSEYSGPLSIKTVREGRVEWSVRGRQLVVDESSFLILAAGERYSMNIESPRPVETCCVFFRAGFVESIAEDATSGLESSLDQPGRAGPALPWLSALHNDAESLLTSRVTSICSRLEAGIAPGSAEEEFLLAAEAILGYYSEIRSAIAKVPAARESTRRELFRRLLIGREFLHSNLVGNVSFRAAARVACLSEFHFHRGFSSAFGQTPREYVTALRLDRARRAIERGESVTAAGMDAGFLSTSAFSRAFRNRFGGPPSDVRRERQN